MGLLPDNIRDDDEIRGWNAQIGPPNSLGMNSNLRGWKWLRQYKVRGVNPKGADL